MYGWAKFISKNARKIGLFVWSLLLTVCPSVSHKAAVQRRSPDCLLLLSASFFFFSFSSSFSQGNGAARFKKKLFFSDSWCWARTRKGGPWEPFLSHQYRTRFAYAHVYRAKWTTQARAWIPYVSVPASWPHVLQNRTVWNNFLSSDSAAIFFAFFWHTRSSKEFRKSPVVALIS